MKCQRKTDHPIVAVKLSLSIRLPLQYMAHNPWTYRNWFGRESGVTFARLLLISLQTHVNSNHLNGVFQSYAPCIVSWNMFWQIYILTIILYWLKQSLEMFSKPPNHRWSYPPVGRHHWHFPGRHCETYALLRIVHLTVSCRCGIPTVLPFPY